MGLETGTTIASLVSSNPPDGDPESQGAGHLRLIKSVLQSSFPTLSGPIGRVQTKALSYTAVLADNFSVLSFSSSSTLNLPAAATLGNGYVLPVLANGSAVTVTITPSSGEKINGLSSLSMPPNSSVFLFSSAIVGNEWMALSLSGILSDALPFLRNATDLTKEIRFDLSGFTTGAVRVITPQDVNGTLAYISEFNYINFVGNTGRLPYPRGHLNGYACSNNSGTPLTNIDVAAGVARDSTDTCNIISTTTLTGVLQASGGWTAGTIQNKLDTGAIAASSTYYVYTIWKTVDGTQEILFSLNATSPVMPSGYSAFRRIFSFRTDGSSHILPWTQSGNTIRLTSTILDVNAQTQTAGTPANYTVSVPPGMEGIFQVNAVRGSNGCSGRIYETWQTDVTLADADASCNVGFTAAGATIARASHLMRVFVDSTSKIRADCVATVNWSIRTVGWIDTRGQG